MDQAKPTDNDKCDKECLETDNKLSTLSTGKCSTDQLICKSPSDSPAGATASPRSISDQFIERNNVSTNAALAFALLQIALGIIISVCGFFIYTHNMASGLWTGPIVIATGVLGAIIQNRSSVSIHRHLLHTWYLILGLVSFALSQLSLVLTVIGLTRLETNIVASANVGVSVMIPQPIDDFLQLTVEMERALAQGLLITVIVATGFECIVAATGVYLQARDSLKLWCCASQEKQETSLLGAADVNGKDTMLHSWLGKLQSPPLTGTVRTNPTTVYMVPTSLPHFKRVNGKQINKPYIRTVLPSAMVPALVPVHVMMQQPQQLVPIIPAPPPSYCPQSIPSPYHPYAAYATLRPPPPTTIMVGRPPNINYHHHPVHMVQRRHTIIDNNSDSNRRHHKRNMKEQRQQQVDMVYTGLDRDIAEQYIECCDSRKSTITSNSTAEST